MNRLISILQVAFSLLFVPLFCCQAYAANDSVTGGQTITLQGSTSTCVIPIKNKVSITITSVRVPSDKPWPTWLKSVDSFGAKVDLSIDGPSGTNKHVSFPIGKLVSSISPDNSAPVIRATLNIPVLVQYKLFDADGNFAHIDMPLTLVRTDNNKGMQDLISALTQVTSAIKLPASPFEPGIQAFGSFVNNMFTAENSDGNTNSNAVLGFELVDDDSECATNGQALRSGAQAEIWTSPNKGKGIIDIGDYTKYCYYSTGGSDPNILYSSMPVSQACSTTAPAGAPMLNNPQVIFVVNVYALPVKPISASNLTPEMLPSTELFSSTGKNNFSAFAGRVQENMILSDHKITSDDLTVLGKKLDAIRSKNETENETKSTLKLTKSDQRALILLQSLQNCALVGLTPKNCN